MGRVNKQITGAFTTLVGDEQREGTYDSFVNYGKTFDKSNELLIIEDYYETLVGAKIESLKAIAGIEELIMQMRSRENIGEISYDIVRQYIYARTAFYRGPKEAKDIRVLMGTTYKFSPDIKKLYKDTKLLDLSQQKLKEAMSKEIEITKSKLRLPHTVKAQLHHVEEEKAEAEV